MWTYVCEQEIIFSNICLHFVKKFEEVITYLFFLIFHKSSLTNPLYSNFHDFTEEVSMRRGIPGLTDEKRRRRREDSMAKRSPATSTEWHSQPTGTGRPVPARYKDGGGRRAVPNQRVCDFADPPTEEEGGGNPKKVAQCKRVKFGGRRAGPTRQYNSRGVQWGANPAMNILPFLT